MITTFNQQFPFETDTVPVTVTEPWFRKIGNGNGHGIGLDKKIVFQ